MGFLDKMNQKIMNKAKEEVSIVLLDGEVIEDFYLVKEDYCCLTNLRLIFIDKSWVSSRKVISCIPYANITGVGLGKGGFLSFSKDVIVQIGNRTVTIDLYDEKQAAEIHKKVSSKALKHHQTHT